MKSETVIDMVRARIINLGHDGLVSESRECACLVGDLAPCGEINERCESGIRSDGCTPDCGNGCDFHITAICGDGSPVDPNAPYPAGE
jgi:hypothetical protein